MGKIGNYFPHRRTDEAHCKDQVMHFIVRFMVVQPLEDERKRLKHQQALLYHH